MLSSLVYGLLFEYEREYVRLNKTYVTNAKMCIEASKLPEVVKCELFSTVDTYFKAIIEQLDNLVQSYEKVLTEFDSGNIEADEFYSKLKEELSNHDMQTAEAISTIATICGQVCAVSKFIKKTVNPECVIS
jgi:predicted transcriptional regulator